MRYTIIGADGNQYGPITAENVRGWIAEGRLNAQSMAKAEQETEFRPLSAFAEFADAFAPQAPQPAAPGLAGPTPWPEGDYHLAVGDCIARGWELVKKNFWPTVGVTFLVMLAIAAMNQIIGLFTRPAMTEMFRQHHASAGGIFILVSASILGAPIYVVLIAGLFRYFLNLIRGQSATVGDAFSGFGPSLGQLVLLGWVQAALVLTGFAFLFIPGLYLSVAWYFATALVIDKGMGFWEAMELSRKMVSKHWFVVFGFLIVYGLLIAVGVIACLIGIVVTMPIAIAALMYGYESVFSNTSRR